MFNNIRFFTILSCLLLTFTSLSQSFWFGVKGGGGLMSQTWGSGFSGNSNGRDVGFGYNGDLFIESFDPDQKGSLYASLGYHLRGSAIQFNSFNGDFNDRQTFEFRNAVFEVGAKKPFFLDKDFDPYFTIGIRGEYTIGTNLDDYKMFNSLYYPDNAFVQKWLYGFSFGGGFERTSSEFIKYFMDLSVQPDLRYSYIQPRIPNVSNPWVPNETITVPERLVRNVTIELKFGVRFLRKVIYED